MESVEAELCFPHLPNSSCRKAQVDPAENLISDCLLVIASMLTSALNLLVIIAIAHFRQLHTSTYLILLSLAVSDFLVGLVVIPTEGLKWRSCWTLGDLFCAIYYTVNLTIITASVTNIILISVDRYVAICDPLRYQTRMSRKVVSVCISGCWLYALIYSLVFLSENFTNLGKYKTCHGECLVGFSFELDIVMAFILPVGIIVVLYSRVFVVAITQAHAMRSHVTAMTSKTSKKSEIKAARNLGVIVVVYLMCYCPFYCFANSGANVTILGIPIYFILISFIYLNSCLNPLIYTFLYPWFRKAVELIVTLQIMKPGSCDLTLA